MNVKRLSSIFAFLMAINTSAMAIELPSEVLDKEYVQFINPDKGTHPTNSTRVGKWMIKLSLPNEIKTDEDRARWSQYNNKWLQVIDAIKKGFLGFATKTSTLYQIRKYSDYNYMYIYTRDFMDREDLCRVYSGLVHLGFKGNILYKTDNMTRAKINDIVFGTSDEFCK